MDRCFQLHQSDAEVSALIRAMRVAGAFSADIHHEGLQKETLLRMLADSAKAACALIQQVRARSGVGTLSFGFGWLRRALEALLAVSLHAAASAACCEDRLVLTTPLATSTSQTRTMVFEEHKQSGKDLESCVEEMQAQFEPSMEYVINMIRNKHGVSEQAASAALTAYSSDVQVSRATAASPDLL